MAGRGDRSPGLMYREGEGVQYHLTYPSVADLGFPRGGGANSPGGANI